MITVNGQTFQDGRGRHPTSRIGDANLRPNHGVFKDQHDLHRALCARHAYRGSPAIGNLGGGGDRYIQFPKMTRVNGDPVSRDPAHWVIHPTGRPVEIDPATREPMDLKILREQRNERPDPPPDDAAIPSDDATTDTPTIPTWAIPDPASSPVEPSSDLISPDTTVEPPKPARRDPTRYENIDGHDLLVPWR